MNLSDEYVTPTTVQQLDIPNTVTYHMTGNDIEFYQKQP